MNQNTIGRRIKEARLAKKMTQAEVVGNFITRNMLSQIEGGTAQPSMKTLAYLSQVLELPLSFLLDDTELSRPDDMAALPDSSPAGELNLMREYFHAENYTELLQFLHAMPENDFLYDEKAAYRARAAYEQALALEKKDELPEALALARDAENWASVGFYANQALKADALLLLARLAEELGKRYKR